MDRGTEIGGGKMKTKASPLNTVGRTTFVGRRSPLGSVRDAESNRGWNVTGASAQYLSGS